MCGRTSMQEKRSKCFNSESVKYCACSLFLQQSDIHWLNVMCVAFWVNKPLLNGLIRMYILMLDTRNVEQTKYVLCTLKNIYSSRCRCSHIAVHGWTRNWTEWALEECWFIYTRNKGMRYVRITLRCTIDTGDWIELQWVRNCHIRELNWELSLHCWACS